MKSTLVGGVVIGTSADMIINIWGSMITGGLAAALTVFADQYLPVSNLNNKRLAFRIGVPSPQQALLHKKMGIDDPRLKLNFTTFPLKHNKGVVLKGNSHASRRARCSRRSGI